MSLKLRTLIFVVVCMIGGAPAMSEEMRPDEARHFIAGRHFSYNCFEGTSGHGRIYADGSAAGYIRISGGPVRYVVLPAGTLRVRGDKFCAALRGIPFEPCFNIDRTGNFSFRGSISGFRFAYCDFNRGSARAELSRSRRPLRIEASAGAR
jgi:hypothetical protein